MAKQLFVNNFESVFIANVKDAATSGTPATEIDYGVLRLSTSAAAFLTNPTGGDYYVITAFKRSGAVESNLEIMRVTAVDNSVINECRITVSRAQEGTFAQAYVPGDFVALRFTKGGAEAMLQVSDTRLTATSVINTPAGAIAATTVQAAINELDSEKEAAIAAGTTAQYWRGDKSWRDFFTDVRSATLTGLSTATNAVITATDTVLAAFGKLQAQFTAHFGSGGTAHANATTSVAGFMSSTDKTKLDGVATGATANTGTVTSVALSLPAEFTVTGSPVSTTGTLTATKASQTANNFYAAPNGSAGAPTFRAIVAADIPTLNQSTTGNAATATALQTARTINGVSFNGTANITVADSTKVAKSGDTMTGDLTVPNLTVTGLLDYDHTVSVISTNTTAVKSRTYVMTASLTLTLPASPIAGDWVDVINRSDTTTPVVARNGQNILGYAEDFTVNIANFTGRFIFADATRGWVLG